MAPKTYVDKKVADLVNGAPAQLDTLQELSKALNDDKDFGATVNNAIAKKLDSAGGTVTGNLTVNGTLTAKASTAGTADRALKADTCTGNAATASSVPWSGVTNKPTTFTPSAHNHAWDNITGTPATATRWPAWNEVSGKPNIIKNGTPTKDISLRYETENGKNVVAPYVDGVKVPLSLQDANTGKLAQLYWIDHTENYYRTWQLATKYDENEYILHDFSQWIIPVFHFIEASPSGSAAGEKPNYGDCNYWIDFPNAKSEVINLEKWMSESDIISYIKNSIMPKYNLTAVRYQGSIDDTKHEGIVTQ